MLYVWKGPHPSRRKLPKLHCVKIDHPRGAAFALAQRFCYELHTGVRWKNELMLTFFLHGRNDAYRLCRGGALARRFRHGTEVAGPRLSLTTQTRTIDRRAELPPRSSFVGAAQEML